MEEIPKRRLTEVLPGSPSYLRRDRSSPSQYEAYKPPSEADDDDDEDDDTGSGLLIFRCAKAAWEFFAPEATPLILLTLTLIIILAIGVQQVSSRQTTTWTCFSIYYALILTSLLGWLIVRFAWVHVLGPHLCPEGRIFSSLLAVLDPQLAYLTWTATNLLMMSFLFQSATVDDRGMIIANRVRVSPSNFRTQELFLSPPTEVPMNTLMDYSMNDETPVVTRKLQDSDYECIFLVHNFHTCTYEGPRTVLQYMEIVAVLWTIRNVLVNIAMFYFLTGLSMSFNGHLVAFLTKYSLLRRLQANWLKLAPPEVLEGIEDEEERAQLMGHISDTSNRNPARQAVAALGKLKSTVVVNPKHVKQREDFAEKQAKSLPRVLRPKAIAATQTSPLANLAAIQYCKVYTPGLYVNGKRCELSSKKVARQIGAAIFDELVSFRSRLAEEAIRDSGANPLTQEQQDAAAVVTLAVHHPPISGSRCSIFVTGENQGDRAVELVPSKRPNHDAAANATPEQAPEDAGHRRASLMHIFDNRPDPSAIVITNLRLARSISYSSSEDSTYSDDIQGAILPLIDTPSFGLGAVRGSARYSTTLDMNDNSLSSEEKKEDSGEQLTLRDMGSTTQYPKDNDQSTVTEEWNPWETAAYGVQPSPSRSVSVTDTGKAKLCVASSADYNAEYGAQPPWRAASSGVLLNENLATEILDRVGSRVQGESLREIARINDAMGVSQIPKGEDEEETDEEEEQIVEPQGPQQFVSAFEHRTGAPGKVGWAQPPVEDTCVTRPLLAAFLGDKVDEFFKEADTGGRPQVYRKQFCRMTVSIYKLRKQLLSIVNGQASIQENFRRLLTIVLTTLSVLVVLIVAGVAVNTIIVSGAAVISAITLSLSFFYTNFVQSVVFVCFLNPYNVGDRVRILGEIMTVRKVETFFTEFSDVNAKPVLYTHSYLYSIKIINESRSKRASVDLVVYISDRTPPAVYHRLKKLIQKFVDSRPEYVKGSTFFILNEIALGHYVKFTVWVDILDSWHHWKSVWTSRGLLWQVILRNCDELGVEYKLPVQRVEGQGISFSGTSKPEPPCHTLRFLGAPTTPK